MTAVLWALLVLMAIAAGQAAGTASAVGWTFVLILALILKERRKRAVHSDKCK